MARTDTEAVTAGLAGPLRWHLPDLVAAVDLPVLLLVAPVRDNGSALTGPDRVHLHRLLPADRVLELDGGHCLHRDLPAEWVERVDAFAGSVVRSPVT
jgi:pimeloyl-ACP methyl ester carboxylesterase